MKVQKKSNGQYVVTIDNGIAEGMNLEKAEVEWKIKSQNKLELKIVERASSGDDE